MRGRTTPDGYREVLFTAHAETSPDAEIRVVGSADEIGRWVAAGGVVLRTAPEKYPIWSAVVRYRIVPTDLEYKFIMVLSDGSVVWEQRCNRTFAECENAGPAFVPKLDFGNHREIGRVVPARAPTCIGQETRPEGPRADSTFGATSAMVQFEATCSDTRPGDELRLVGSAQAMGAWMPRNGLRLETTSSLFPQWKVSVILPLNGELVEWKLVICHEHDGETWEHVSNRSMRMKQFAAGEGMQTWTARMQFNGPCSEPEVPKVLRGGAATDFDTRRYNRSNSLHLGALQNIISPPVSSPPSAAPVAGTKPVVMDHILSLRLNGVSENLASELTVKARLAFLGKEVPMQLAPDREDPDQALWKISVADAALPVGFHLLDFLVEGESVLSSDHPVHSKHNAILISEPLRRYILTRETAGVNGELPLDDPHDQSRRPPGPVVNGIVRPWSFAYNLSAIAEDDGNNLIEVSPTKFPMFAPEVFEGLYDPELRLRADGFELPDEELEESRQLRLWSGAQLLQKKMGACEDAFFSAEYALGVADGVGCMAQFSKYGVNAAAYASDLMHYAGAAFQDGAASKEKDGMSAEDRAVAALSAAETGAQAYGASTITTLVLDGTTVGVANLGDSGFMVLRKKPNGTCVVHRSEEQQHSWNCPYQLTRLPKTLASKFSNISLDTADDCDRYSFQVREGDLIILYTDGMRDNLHDREILHIVDRTLSPAFGDLMGLGDHATHPEKLARALALAAQERSLDPTAKVPFVENSKRHGLECLGGKQDDITVVVAWVVPEEPQSKRSVPHLPQASVDNLPRPKSSVEQPCDQTEPDLPSTVPTLTADRNQVPQRLHRVQRNRKVLTRRQPKTGVRTTSPHIMKVASATGVPATQVGIMPLATSPRRRSSSRGRACRVECRPLSGATKRATQV